MSAPYIPPKDADLDSWLNNFNDLITASPATYGLTPADAVTIDAEVDAWNAAYALVIVPSTKTKVTVAAKNAAKISAIILCRTYAAQIRLNPGVTNGDKVALGLNLPNNAPAPIPVPTGFPLLDIAGMLPLGHVLRYADNSTPDSRAKPQNVIHLELWGTAGVAAVVDPALTKLIARVTKQPYQYVWQPGDGGKIATYFARWAIRTGGVGPWSAPINMTIPVSA